MEELHVSERKVNHHPAGRRARRIGVLGWFATIFFLTAAVWFYAYPFYAVWKFEGAASQTSFFYREYESREELKNVLVDAGKPVLIVLLGRIGDRHFPNRDLAIEAAGEIGSCQAIGTLEKIAMDLSERIYLRQKAIEAIGRIGYYDAVMALRRLYGAVADRDLKSSVKTAFAEATVRDRNELLVPGR